MRATENEKLDRVREYFDFDSVKYSSERYPDEPKTCEQLSYVTRKGYVLRMLDRIPIPKGKILDVGCGPGIYTRDLLLRGWEVWGIDLSPKMLERAKASIMDLPEAPRAHFSTGQMEDLAFEPSFFDAVICIGVLPYVGSLEKAVSEAFRVLRPGGYVIFQLSNKLAPIRAESTLKRAVKSLLKRKGDEGDRLLDRFRITHHIPFQFDRLCRQSGFQLRDFRFFDFRVPFVATLSQGWALTFAKRLEPIGASRYFGLFGSGYLALCEKK
jgi:ubiquinone/menaquinone biosynthesis C-methylase UbiE